MSSMYLAKDYERTAPGKEPVAHKKGDVISVPFMEGRKMIADGVAAYWDGGRGAPAAEPEAKAPLAGETPAAAAKRIFTPPPDKPAAAQRATAAAK